MKNNISNLIQVNFKKITVVFLGVFLTFIMGCGQDNSIAGGPSIGGTGPFTTTTNEQIVAMKYEMSGTFSTDANDKTDKAKVGTPAPTAAPTEDKSNSNAVEESSVSNTNTKVDTQSQNTITTKKTEAEADDNKDKTNTNTASTYEIKIINKSADKLQCNGFERSINLLNNNLPVTNFTTDRIDEITIETAVKNPTNKNISEIKSNCNNYQLKDFDDNIYNTQVKECKKPREVLMFLPKQTHKYTLRLSKLLPGKYRIDYLNIANKSNVSAEKRATCETYIDIEVTQ